MKIFTGLTPFLVATWSLLLPTNNIFGSDYRVDLRAQQSGTTAGDRPERPLSSNSLPANLQTSNNEKLSVVAFAKGVQIYQCQPQKQQAGKFEWSLKAPAANLFDRQQQLIGKHYAGPTWEASDGSKVVGEIKAKVAAKATDAIPWLLLTAKKGEGKGIFSQITSIQRIDTAGGKAPTDACTSTSVGQERRVSYTATYNFYTTKN